MKSRILNELTRGVGIHDCIRVFESTKVCLSIIFTCTLAWMASTSKVDFTAIHAEATKVYHCRRILVQSEVTTLLTAGALTKFENFEHRTTNCVIIVIIQYICSAPITC